MLVLVLGELGGGGGQLGFSFCVTVLWWFAFLVRGFVAALSLAVVGHVFGSQQVANMELKSGSRSLPERNFRQCWIVAR